VAVLECTVLKPGASGLRTETANRMIVISDNTATSNILIARMVGAAALDQRYKVKELFLTDSKFGLGYKHHQSRGFRAVDGFGE